MRKKYIEWLELFTEDSYYWIPAWEDEENIISDPNHNVSLLYLPNKKEMEIYIKRIISGKAPSYVPYPRTIRIVSNVYGELEMEKLWKIRYNFVMYVYRNLYRKIETYAGNTEIGIIKDDNHNLKIKYKKSNVGLIKPAYFSSFILMNPLKCFIYLV